MRALASQPDAEFVLSSLGLLEFRCTLRRRERAGDVGRAEVEQILLHWQQQSGLLWVRLALTDATFSIAAELAERHALRSLDALQLATCLGQAHRDPTFVCADRKLIEAAQAEGLPCLDPTDADSGRG